MSWGALTGPCGQLLCRALSQRLASSRVAARLEQAAGPCLGQRAEALPAACCPSTLPPSLPAACPWQVFGLPVREYVRCSSCGKSTHENSYTQHFYNTQVGSASPQCYYLSEI